MKYQPHTPLREGDLVQIYDEEYNQLGIGVYVERVVPEDIGIEYEKLMECEHIIRVKSGLNSKLFYAIPSVWHSAVLRDSCIIYLNENLYTLVKIDEITP